MATTLSFPPLEARPLKNTICLFDVDETLTPARRTVSPDMAAALIALRHKCAIGSVSGSDLRKQQEQIGDAIVSGGMNVVDFFDFAFAENGLTAYRMGEELPSNSFIKWLGEDRYKEFVKFTLHYIADLDIPVKRGTFIEFRNGLINVSPIGRNASNEERDAFNKYDQKEGVRQKMVEVMREKFGHWDLIFSIGGAISFDVFPKGWDKTYCLKHVEAETQRPDGIEFTTIHFFGDKTDAGGNDHEIYSDPRTVGHSVKNPEDTLRMLKEMFDL